MNGNRKFARRLLLSLQVRLSRIWRNTPFFVQSQMDIHPESAWYNEALIAETGGFMPSRDNVGRAIVDHDCWDGVRRDMILLLLRCVEEERVPGAFAELGVYKGGTARLIHRYAPEREFHLFDTFEGFDERDATRDPKALGHSVDRTLFKDTSLEVVKTTVGCRNGAVHFHKGFFPETFNDDLRSKQFAFVHLDADLQAPIASGLEVFYDLLAPGGVLLIHDYNAWLGARKAVDEFVQLRRLAGVPMPDKSGSYVLRKSYA